MKSRDKYTIVVWGDLQAHPWQELERPDRWRELLCVFGMVNRVAKDHDADAIVFLGDLFQNKRTLRADVVGETLIQFARAIEEFDKPYYIMEGNHDLCAGVYVPQILGALLNVRLVTGIPTTFSPGLREGRRNNPILKFVPYRAITNGTAEHIKSENYDILFLHADVLGAKYRVAGSDIDVTETKVPDKLLLQASTRKLVINGHIHHPQWVKRRGYVDLYCVGSPMQLNWLDADSHDVPRGCAIVTITHDSAEVLPIEFDFPRFHCRPNKYMKPGDFVRSDTSDVDSAIHQAIGDDALQQHENCDIIGGHDMAEAIDEYVALKEKEQATATRLISLGRRLVTHPQDTQPMEGP